MRNSLLNTPQIDNPGGWITSTHFPVIPSSGDPERSDTHEVEGLRNRIRGHAFKRWISRVGVGSQPLGVWCSAWDRASPNGR